MLKRMVRGIVRGPSSCLILRQSASAANAGVCLARRDLVFAVPSDQYFQGLLFVAHRSMKETC